MFEQLVVYKTNNICSSSFNKQEVRLEVISMISVNNHLKKDETKLILIIFLATF